MARRNLDRLGEQLGLALELREAEHPVGRYALDILANDVIGRLVVIENDLGQSDHDHLGKLLTYAAGTDITDAFAAGRGTDAATLVFEYMAATLARKVPT